MRRGGPSLNPGGRPRRGESLAEAVRELVEPAELIGFLLAIMRSPVMRIADRLTAAGQLLDRGWGKALQPSEISVNATGELPAEWGALSPDERAAHLRALGVGDS